MRVHGRLHVQREGGAPSEERGGARKSSFLLRRENSVPIYVLGVNRKDYKTSGALVSNAPCAKNRVAPLTKVVHETFGIVERLDDDVARDDGDAAHGAARFGKDWRDGRCASQIIITSSTGSAKAVGQVISPVNGQVDGHGPPCADAGCLRGQLDVPLGGGRGKTTSWLRLRRPLRVT